MKDAEMPTNTQEEYFPGWPLPKGRQASEAVRLGRETLLSGEMLDHKVEP